MNPPTRQVVEANTSIYAILDRRFGVDPAADLPPHSKGNSDGDSFYILSYLEGAGHKFTVLFHLMVIVKPPLPPMAQLAISALDESTMEYLSKETNDLGLKNTAVAPTGLDIQMTGVGHLTGTIDQLTVEGHTTCSSNSLDIELTMNPQGPILPNLITGMIPFSDGVDYEYAFPSMQTSGTLTFGGKVYNVTGSSWLDREWGRFGPSKWTWMNIQLVENGVKMSLWDEQNDDSKPDSHVGGPVRFATILNPDDSLIVTAVEIQELDHWKSSRTGRTYAKKWHLTIPGRADLTVTLLKEGQEIVSELEAHRVEGKAQVEGSYGNIAVKGDTTVEMYDLFPFFRALAKGQQ